MNTEVWELPIGKAITPAAVRSRLVVDTAEAALDAARGGAGVIRLYSFNVADAVRVGELTVLLEAFEPPPCPSTSFIWVAVSSGSKSGLFSTLRHRN